MNDEKNEPIFAAKLGPFGRFIENDRLLNWSIGILVLLHMFARTWLEHRAPAMHWFFVFIPLGLLTWSGASAFREMQPAEPSAPFPHQRFQSGDFFRVFLILWAGHDALAARHLFGFYIFSAIAVVLLFILITIIGVEVFRHRNLTGWIFGCSVFAYCLLSWEQQVFVQHYGVPIIGHFFERPEYDARYYVQAQRDNSSQKYRLVAEIHVKHRFETDEIGEDNYGMPHYETSKYRDVWVRRLHFPNGGSVTIADQMEPLYLGESVFATDTRGETWHLKLLNESAH